LGGETGGSESAANYPAQNAENFGWNNSWLHVIFRTRLVNQDR
jgi:hypothetical protein